MRLIYSSEMRLPYYQRVRVVRSMIIVTESTSKLQEIIRALYQPANMERPRKNLPVSLYCFQDDAGFMILRSMRALVDYLVLYAVVSFTSVYGQNR